MKAFVDKLVNKSQMIATQRGQNHVRHYRFASRQLLNSGGIPIMTPIGAALVAAVFASAIAVVLVNVRDIIKGKI